MAKKSGFSVFINPCNDFSIGSGKHHVVISNLEKQTNFGLNDEMTRINFIKNSL